MKRRKSSTQSGSLPKSSPDQKVLPLDIGSPHRSPSAPIMDFGKKRLSSCSSLVSSFSSLSTSISSTSSTFSPTSPANTPPSTHFNTIIFSQNHHHQPSSVAMQKNQHALDFSVDPKVRMGFGRDPPAALPSSSQLHNILAPIRLPTTPPVYTRLATLNWKLKSQIQLLAITARQTHQLAIQRYNNNGQHQPPNGENPLAKLKDDSFQVPSMPKATATSAHITEQQMLQCLEAYFTTCHPAYPMLDPNTWYRKAKTAWRAIEYGSVLSFNQIELAIVYMLVSLGARESGPEMAHWGPEYFLKTSAIFPNVYDVPMCLSVAQFMVLSSMALVLVDPAKAASLAAAATHGATSLGLHILADNAVYVNSPALNALESHRTWVAAYLWVHTISAATGQPVDLSGAPHVTLNAKAYAEIGYNTTNFLAVRMKVCVVARMHHANPVTSSLYSPPVPTVPQTTAALSAAFGNSDTYRQEMPPAPLSSGIANKLNKGASQNEWLHVRVAYFATSVLVYLPYMLSQCLAASEQSMSASASQLEDWNNGTRLCIDSAFELGHLVLAIPPSNPGGYELLDSTKIMALELSAAVLTYFILACETSSPSGGPLTPSSPAQSMLFRIAEALNIPSFLDTLLALPAAPPLPGGHGVSGRDAGLSSSEIARILFGKRPVLQALTLRVGDGPLLPVPVPVNVTMQGQPVTAGMIWMRVLKMLD